MPAFKELLTLPLGNNTWFPVCILVFFIGQISHSLQLKLIYHLDFICFSLKIRNVNISCYM